ncbi:MAG: formyl transferase [Nanohaloarchaea archaeon]|nr:formyl transferase [Candidatus Nanohaloarchaea archaeon]
MDLVFLGMNPAGEKTLEWLKEREDVELLVSIKEKKNLGLIEEERPELVISSGFEHKVPKEILEVPEKGVVNLHPSFLPFNRGAHPYVWPLIDGTPAGVSIHYMNEGIDEGPVISRRKVEKKETDTAKDLYDRLQHEMFQLFKDSWRDIKKGVEGSEQDLAKGTVHKSSDLDDLASINPNEEFKAKELVDLLRALSFPPHGMASIDGKFLELNVRENVGDEPKH